VIAQPKCERFSREHAKKVSPAGVLALASMGRTLSRKTPASLVSKKRRYPSDGWGNDFVARVMPSI
jgi:hypothetical protein